MKFFKRIGFLILFSNISYAAPKANLSASITSLDSDVQTLNTAVSSLNTSVGPLNTSIGGLNASIGTLNTSSSTLNATALTLNQTLQMIGLNTQTLNTSVQSLKGSTDTLNSTNVTLNTSTQNLNQTNGTLNTNIQSLNQKINSLQGSVDALKASIDNMAMSSGNSSGSSEQKELIFINNCSVTTPVSTLVSYNYRCLSYRMVLSGDNSNGPSSDVIYEVPAGKEFVMTGFTTLFFPGQVPTNQMLLLEKNTNNVTSFKKQLFAVSGGIVTVFNFSNSAGGITFPAGSKLILGLANPSGTSNYFQFEMTGYLINQN